MDLDGILWKGKNYLEVKEIWKYYTSYCYLPKLVDYNVLETSIREGLTSRNYFAIADGVSSGKFINLRWESDFLTFRSVFSHPYQETNRRRGTQDICTRNNRNTYSRNSPSGDTADSRYIYRTIFWFRIYQSKISECKCLFLLSLKEAGQRKTRKRCKQDLRRDSAAT